MVWCEPRDVTLSPKAQEYQMEPLFYGTLVVVWQGVLASVFLTLVVAAYPFDI